LLVSLSITITEITLAGFTAAYIIHYFLRGRKQGSLHIRHEYETFETNAPVRAYDRTQRLVHWFIAGIFLFLTATGFEIYLFPNLAVFHFSVFSLLWHEYFSFALILLLAIHTFHELYSRRSLRLIVFTARDARLMMERVGRFARGSLEQQRTGKYDPFKKIYHASLGLATGVLAVTGVYLWDPFRLLPVQGLPAYVATSFLVAHIYASVLVLGLVAGHIYFSTLPQNRPLFRAITRGTLSPQFFSVHYDSSIWIPDAVKAKASVVSKLTASLSEEAFTKYTGLQSRRLLANPTASVFIPFSAVQKTCGSRVVRSGAERCSRKKGALCLSDACPVLGTYTPPQVEVARRQFIKRSSMLTGAILLMALGVDFLAKRPRAPPSGGATSTAAAGPKPIANIRNLLPNAATYFSDPSGGPGILIRLPSGTLEAYSAICTHAGCEVQYYSPDRVIYCPCHGSLFDPSNGDAIRGPAYVPLQKIGLTLDQATGNIYVS
jgi:Rieske Fe-S protein/cytochrome b subunit of formate dehydrogenase